MTRKEGKIKAIANELSAVPPNTNWVEIRDELNRELGKRISAYAKWVNTYERYYDERTTEDERLRMDSNPYMGTKLSRADAIEQIARLKGGIQLVEKVMLLSENGFNLNEFSP